MLQLGIDAYIVFLPRANALIPAPKVFPVLSMSSSFWLCGAATQLLRIVGKLGVQIPLVLVDTCAVLVQREGMDTLARVGNLC